MIYTVFLVNLLCNINNLTNDDIIDGIIAHLLNLKKVNLSIEIIEDYEAQVLNYYFFYIKFFKLLNKAKLEQNHSNNAYSGAVNVLQRLFYLNYKTNFKI